MGVGQERDQQMKWRGQAARLENANFTPAVKNSHLQPWLQIPFFRYTQPPQELDEIGATPDYDVLPVVHCYSGFTINKRKGPPSQEIPGFHQLHWITMLQQVHGGGDA